MTARRPLVLVSGVPAELPTTDSLLGVSASQPTIYEFEQDLGSAWRTSGSFSILPTGSPSAGQKVFIQTSPGPYTGKGTLADEFEMDTVTISAVIIDFETMTCYWRSDSPVRGNFKFRYFYGA